jgi:DtxR family transcriptional regulator, Mn-dependent transcriptional regulator
MNKRQSMEDYLERILMLQEKNEIVRSIDIAHSMSFSKASISVAVKKLVEQGYINHDLQTGQITLTDAGLKIASATYDRHKTLSKFFEHLGVDENVALEDACAVEHDLSDQTYEKLKAFVEKL